MCIRDRIYDVNSYKDFLEFCHFDYLYDKVNLYDTLKGMECDNLSAAQLSSCWQRVDGIGDLMLNFLENHDEVRFASREFAGNPAKAVPFLVVSAMMTKGPFMIYYGQELGEMAVDNEGFAGDNNRSTIFDYWSYDTMRRWYDAGRCSTALLTPHERWLRSVYSRVLNLCNEAEAIREGAFFDLMYVNLRNPAFDPHRHFAFIRYSETEALLFVVNFDSKAANIGVMIPDLAFDMAIIEEGIFHTTDLIWGLDHTFEVSRDKPVSLEVGGYDAVIVPLQKIVTKSSRK